MGGALRLLPRRGRRRARARRRYGTADADDADPPPGAYEQARRCLEIVTEALAQAGATPAEVVRTCIFVTHRNHIADVMRAHAETFSEARPACTGLVVELLDPRWLVEIEADAVLRS